MAVDPQGLRDPRLDQRSNIAQFPATGGEARTENVTPEPREGDFIPVRAQFVDNLRDCHQRLRCYVEDFLGLQEAQQHCATLVSHMERKGKYGEDDFWEDAGRLLKATKEMSFLSEFVASEKSEFIGLYQEKLESAKKRADRARNSPTQRPSHGKAIKATADSMETAVQRLGEWCEQQAREWLGRSNEYVTAILALANRMPDTGDSHGTPRSQSKLPGAESSEVAEAQSTRGPGPVEHAIPSTEALAQTDKQVS